MNNMGHSLDIEKIVISNDVYYNWTHRGDYLNFDEGRIISFEGACTDLGLVLKDHYETEDDYLDDKFEIEQELYWHGYYSYDSIGGDFEDGKYIEWDFISVGDHWVIIRASVR